MHCSLNINDSFEVDKRVVMWPFLPAERLCRWSIVYDYCKKKWHADLLQRRWGQTQKEPSCFSMELIAVLVTDFNENYAENHLFPNGNLVPRGRGCPNGSSQQNWKRKQYKSMETEPLSLINWTKNWTTKLRNWSKVAEITTPKTDQYPFF